jgi:putative FmdB family regulatory protein
MPTYEYVCTECATPLEVVAAFSDPPLTQCPTCGGRLRKVFGNVGVVFKGSGFYRTDSRSKPSSTSSASTSTPAEKSPPAEKGSPASTPAAASSTTPAAPAAASAS